MVVELVEISCLWGCIVVCIDLEWVEFVVQYLIKCIYSELYWEWVQGVVMVMEKVIVYGLLIVVVCKVNYSQIDLVLCCEFFICYVLVEGDWQMCYVFFCENLKLWVEVEELEYKLCCCDILVDDEMLFEFYDQCISYDVIFVCYFDSWWKKVSCETFDLFNFEKSMLIKEGVEKISKLDYLNFWYQGNFKLCLSYQFELGVDVDGVIVYILLLLFNQVEESGFEWQIFGLCCELVIVLIKLLLKLVCCNFVFVLNYVEVFLGCVILLELLLFDSFECELWWMIGVIVDCEDWYWDQVFDYLKIIFCVVDDKNKKLKEGCLL